MIDSQKIQQIIQKYEIKESAIIEILHYLQKEKRIIEDSDLIAIENQFNIPFSKLKSVATFYTMYSQKKLGKYHIQICKNISCHIAGSNHIKRYIKEKLNIKDYISEDGIWSLEEVECLGACHKAPVIIINGTYYENINEKKLDELINEIKLKESK